jgi:hypothetical protein
VDSTPDNILNGRLCACNPSFSIIFRVFISTCENTSWSFIWLFFTDRWVPHLSDRHQGKSRLNPKNQPSEQTLWTKAVQSLYNKDCVNAKPVFWYSYKKFQCDFVFSTRIVLLHLLGFALRINFQGLILTSLMSITKVWDPPVSEQ